MALIQYLHGTVLPFLRSASGSMGGALDGMIGELERQIGSEGGTRAEDGKGYVNLSIPIRFTQSELVGHLAWSLAQRYEPGALGHVALNRAEILHLASESVRQNGVANRSYPTNEYRTKALTLVDASLPELSD
jgi:hypothetical protein